MRIETGLTTQRKLLAQAIGEWLHMEPHYDGVPRCTYSIGPVRVDKDAAIRSITAATGELGFWRSSSSHCTRAVVVALWRLTRRESVRNERRPRSMCHCA